MYTPSLDYSKPAQLRQRRRVVVWLLMMSRATPRWAHNEIESKFYKELLCSRALLSVAIQIKARLVGVENPHEHILRRAASRVSRWWVKEESGQVLV